MSNQIETLGDMLPKELDRCRELLSVYIALGPMGVFGSTSIRNVIAQAEAALASGDVVAMIDAYKALKGCE